MRIHRRPAREHGRVSGKSASRGRTARVSVRESSLRVQQFASKIFAALNTEVSSSLLSMSLSGDWAGVVKAKVDPRGYPDSLSFFLDYQATKLVSKNPTLPTGLNTQKAAEAKFIAAEVSCLEANARFRNSASRDIPGLDSILMAAQRKIADILGDVPTLSDLTLAFGPGAALGVRKNTTVYHKLTAPLESTHSMIDRLSDLLSEVPGWIEADQASVNLVNGSDLAFVPKDATTDRAICIEPLLNGFLQKGIGTYIRERLMRHGVNLNDQSINQGLAMMAMERGLSTVDFSSASDTIAYGLVWELLPPSWCELLDSARCPRFRYEGVWYNFQKFSSMGNAYTFELETLIFYGLAYACIVESGLQPRTGYNLHVYGDDVIIPRVAFDIFRDVSTYCGFTFNETKSYRTGVFFESCGTDVFMGRLVTPFRLKRGLSTPRDLFYAANLVTRLIVRIQENANTEQISSTVYKTRLADLADVHRWLVSLIPPHRMVLGPFDEGDDWLISAFDRVCPSKGTFGWRHRRVIVTAVKYKPDNGLWPMSYALYAAQTIRASAGPKGDDLAPVLWSEGASLRTATKWKVGVTWSSDWRYPLSLAGILWQGY